MVVRVSAQEARNTLADLLDQVHDDGQVVIVERAGRPMVAMIPIEMYEELVAGREARFQALDRVRERLPDHPAAEVAADVAEAVAAVRVGNRAVP